MNVREAPEGDLLRPMRLMVRCPVGDIVVSAIPDVVVSAVVTVALRNDLAIRFERLSNEFCLNLHYNYSHDPGFRETYREAYQMLQIAKYIHEADHELDRRAIRKQLSGVDQLFHHIQEDVRGWSRFHQGHGHKEIVSQMTLISDWPSMFSTLVNNEARSASMTPASRYRASISINRWSIV